jgi:ABC-type Co2+ transport system permease subunit
MNNLFDMNELIKRVIKYLIEGLMVAIAAFAIPKRSLNIEEIISLALTSAATFAILDTYLPSVSVSTKQGLGLGLGLRLSQIPALL